MTEQRLLLVHAHPDDECLSTGGTIARYSEAGAHVCLVTCTNGELGEVAEVPDLGPVTEVRDRLGEIRITELEAALRCLGTVDLRLLGYHDSGMAGTDTNDLPHVFINQDRAEATSKLVAILREVRPQVVVTYNEYGFYGHPDHIRAHEIAMAAVERAADPDDRAPGPPHEVAKVYHTAVPKALFRRARDDFARNPSGEERFSDEEIERIGTDDEQITTELDVRPYVERKFRAIEAHRTQLGTTAPFLEMPPEVREAWFGTEYFVLANTTLPVPGEIERDLFEGVA